MPPATLLVGQVRGPANTRAPAAADAAIAHMLADLDQTLAVLQRLRLDAQLAALDAGAAADNCLHPDALRRLDRELLRDALRVARDFRQHIRLAFRLSD